MPTLASDSTGHTIACQGWDGDRLVFGLFGGVAGTKEKILAQIRHNDTIEGTVLMGDQETLDLILWLASRLADRHPQARTVHGGIITALATFWEPQWTAPDVLSTTGVKEL